MQNFFGKKYLNRAKYFDQVYRNNLFHGKESLSGEGSSLDATRVLRLEIPILLKQFQISSILDVPCGDLHWMKEILNITTNYTGADISRNIVNQNKKKFKQCNFLQLDVVEQIPGYYDLIFCRDLLVHLPLDHAVRALKNFCMSGSKYLLTTTFTDRDTNDDFNYSSEIVQWRPLNLSIEPFNLPVPMTLIVEECREGGGLFSDKSMALYELNSIRKVLSSSGKYFD
jgi:SAM-dependent methyltransferase